MSRTSKEDKAIIGKLSDYELVGLYGDGDWDELGIVQHTETGALTLAWVPLWNNSKGVDERKIRDIMLPTDADKVFEWANLRKNSKRALSILDEINGWDRMGEGKFSGRAFKHLWHIDPLYAEFGCCDVQVKKLRRFVRKHIGWE
jgi:hypothetical protein